MVFDYIMNTFF